MDNGYAVNLPLSTLNFLNSHGGAKRIGAFNQLYSTGYAGFSGSLYIHNPPAALAAFRQCTSNVHSTAPRRRAATGNPSDLQPLNERAVNMRMRLSYPTRAKREGRQGQVSYSVRVDADGRVSSCSVTQSSGYADIDETVCRSAKTLRFPAAESGNNRERSWSGTANFRLSQ
ncbi:MAG: TonB family protein [Candidatus Saccharibacteria bacterium]|nr:TonB family protein [Candidatus Saccharibacteria bacterium]